MKKIINLSLLFILILPITLFSTPIASQDDPSTKVILIDEGHGQFINSSLLTQAITDLTENLGYEVITSSEPITNLTISGVDLLIIPNPGHVSFSAKEISTIQTWKNQGGKAMMFLANPLDLDNSSLNGDIRTLNNLISSSAFGFNSETFVYSQDPPENPVFVQNLDSVSSNVLTVTQSNFSADFDFGKSKIQLKTQSTALNLVDIDPLVKTGYDSYIVDQNTLFYSQEERIDLFAVSEKANTRYIFGGSTLMFSDLQNSEGHSWYDSGDNSLFWRGIVNWGLNFDISSIPEPVHEENIYILSGILIVTGAVFVTGGSIAYATGKEIKLFEIDQTRLSSKPGEDKEKESPMSKSQKKLQQRMKQK